jgi:hypothetical protein
MADRLQGCARIWKHQDFGFGYLKLAHFDYLEPTKECGKLIQLDDSLEVQIDLGPSLL